MLISFILVVYLYLFRLMVFFLGYCWIFYLICLSMFWSILIFVLMLGFFCWDFVCGLLMWFGWCGRSDDGSYWKVLICKCVFIKSGLCFSWSLFLWLIWLIFGIIVWVLRKRFLLVMCYFLFVFGVLVLKVVMFSSLVVNNIKVILFYDIMMVGGIWFFFLSL